MMAGVGSAFGRPLEKNSGSVVADTSVATASPFAAFAIQNMETADGTKLFLQPVERGLFRRIVTPDGQIIDTTFTLLNGRLGVVSDDREYGHIVGMFALSGMTISTIYTNGGSETLVFDDAQSVSIVAHNAENELACVSWRPAGHVFPGEEGQSALAPYPARRGLRSWRSTSSTQYESDSCISDTNIARRAQEAAGEELRKQPAVPPILDPASADEGRNTLAWEEFDNFYSGFVVGHEGGYTANDGNGSPANYGINQGANPDIDVVSLTQPEAEEILYERYWLASGADKLPFTLAMVHADTAINMGVRTANDLLAQSNGDPAIYLDLRGKKYRAIAAASPDKAYYLPIWLERVEDLRTLVRNGSSRIWNDASDFDRPSMWRSSILVTNEAD